MHTITLGTHDRCFFFSCTLFSLAATRAIILDISLHPLRVRSCWRRVPFVRTSFMLANLFEPKQATKFGFVEAVHTLATILSETSIALATL